MKARYIPFYPDEWLAGTTRMSAVDLGIYITICALIYSHGGPVNEDELKRHVGEHGLVINASLARLEKAGKVRRNGREIVQERCENELRKLHKRSENGSENAARRWKNKGLDGEVALPPSNANQNQNQNQKSANADNARATDFAEWWLTYPHKVGKGAAEKAFVTASKVASLDELIEGVRRYAASKPPDHNWCNPATWLNQRRWEDQPAAPLHPQGVNGHARQRRSPSDKLHAGAFAAAQDWDRSHGDSGSGEPPPFPLLDR